MKLDWTTLSVWVACLLFSVACWVALLTLPLLRWILLFVVCVALGEWVLDHWDWIITQAKRRANESEDV